MQAKDVYKQPCRAYIDFSDGCRGKQRSKDTELYGNDRLAEDGDAECEG